MPLGSTDSLPLGVVIRRLPARSRWQKWLWRATAVLPGAAPADWRELRRAGPAVEYHAATVQLVLHRADTEAYVIALAEAEPGVHVILRHGADDTPDALPQVATVTASPFEAQDYADSGDEIVEKVAMPAGLVAWVTDFVGRPLVATPFVKCRRGPKQTAPTGRGLGDARIAGPRDVYRAPGGSGRGR